MLFDQQHVFINGESYLAKGRDAKIMRQLANERALSAGATTGLSADAIALVQQWAEAGWVEGLEP
jgi:50S ribosomal protein L16 3-hydroxylase